jgi:anti-sigma factor RsiW
MLHDNIKPIWEWLDGEGTPAERAAIEQRTTDDADFARALRVRHRLHQILRTSEAEQPSMYFVAKVMERLPTLYRLPVAPLVKPIWLRVFAWFTAFYTIACIGVALVLPGEPNPSEPTLSFLSDALMIHSYLLKLSDSALHTLYLIGFSFLCLAALDWQLKR